MKRVAAEIAAPDPPSPPTPPAVRSSRDGDQDIRPRCPVIGAAALLFLITSPGTPPDCCSPARWRAREPPSASPRGRARAARRADFAEGVLVSLAGAAGGVPGRHADPDRDDGGSSAPGNRSTDGAALCAGSGWSRVRCQPAPLWQAARTAPADALATARNVGSAVSRCWSSPKSRSPRLLATSAVRFILRNLCAFRPV